MDTCGTNRTQPAESMRWGAGRTRKNRRTDTGGAARLEIAWHEPGTPGSYRRTLGDAQQREREPGAVAPNPPRSPVTPPGLSGTMGSPSPAAADTGAARRHPAGPARAATAQSMAAPAPAPAPAASVAVTATCMRPVMPLPVATRSPTRWPSTTDPLMSPIAIMIDRSSSVPPVTHHLQMDRDLAVAST